MLAAVGIVPPHLATAIERGHCPYPFKLPTRSNSQLHDYCLPTDISAVACRSLISLAVEHFLSKEKVLGSNPR